MAMMIKDVKRPAGSSGYVGIVEQWIRVRLATNLGAGILLPATTTGQLFRVKGGKVLVQALVGTCTVAADATNPVLKVSSKQLSDASVAVGTAVDIASQVDASSLEIGGTVFVEGDGTALVKTNAGAVAMGTNTGKWVAPQGEIYLTTGGTNLTGKFVWDIWYQPLDPGAFVEVAPLTVTGLLTAAI